ncbi:MAG: hypothetical protein SNJ59_03490 [Aggregatilineales bacterium]
MRTRTLLLTSFFLLALVVSAAAQTPPDYAIRNIRTVLPSQTGQLALQFEVRNLGGPASIATTARVVVAATGQVLAEQTVAPLAADQEVTLTIELPTASLPAGTQVSLRAEVGIGDIEPVNAPTIDNNVATIRVVVPAVAPDGSLEVTAPETQVRESAWPFGIDPTNPLHAALLLGAGGILLILIWMLTVILRLIFVRPPTFTTWQPPYTMMPLLDPNSTGGRRQLWQQHAQSDALPLPCVSGSFMARKIALGMNGVKLDRWRVTALRLSQYDMYGRVARTQVVASQRVVNRIDRAVRKSAKLTPKRAQSLLRPAANRLMRTFWRKIKRTPGLPIALDLRLRGLHGEVRILFELHQCVEGRWQRIDQWEPEMNVMSGFIYENFTYALYGQQAGETPRQFRKRLRNDLTQALVAMIVQAPAAAPDLELTADTAQLKTVEQAADTLPG